MTAYIQRDIDLERDNGPLDVLLVEDDPAYARLVDRLIRKSGDGDIRLRHVDRMESALRQLESADYSLILSDLGLEDCSGLETVERLFTASPDTPLVVLTANGDSSVAIDAMKVGAQDYLVKGEFDGNVLTRVVHHAIERKRAQQRIAWLAHHDLVTGLPNRALFQDRLERVIARCRREGTGAALHFLDLDRFKQVNDVLGHVVGDRLLIEVAERLQNCVREVDTVARIGGDEFVVIETDVRSTADASALATKLLQAFDEPFRINDREVVVGVSVGISVYPNDGKTPDELLRSADVTLNTVKSVERGRFLFFDPKMGAELERAQELEKDLRSAIANDELELHFQPKYHLANGLPIGVEALVRWRRGSGEMVFPDEFIPVAEVSGQISDIGQWVLRRACRDIADLGRALDLPLGVAVNLSPVELQNPDLAEAVYDAVADSGIRPDLVEIEVTETAMIEDRSGAVYRTLSDLRQAGLGLAIDDFGTGYASLSQLLRFPFNSIKIDRSFMSDIASGGAATEIVRAILALGRGLSKTVVAEGIEEPYQAKMLLREGCSFGQGYAYSRPLPLGEVQDFLHNQVVSARTAMSRQAVDPVLEASLQTM